jgi:hypothetical protein
MEDVGKTELEKKEASDQLKEFMRKKFAIAK